MLHLILSWFFSSSRCLQFVQYARGNTPGQNIDGKRLQDILHSTPNADEQQKVKIAFAEGSNRSFEDLYSSRKFLIRLCRCSR